MRQPIATWSRARGVWETPEVNLLCGHSVPYSETWPTSGTTRAGRHFPRPALERPTGASESRSSPGLPTLLGTPRTASANGVGNLESQVAILLKTPTSQLAVNGGSQHPDKRRQGGHGPTLADEVEHLLPTPQAADAVGSRVESELGGTRPSGAKRSISLSTATAHGPLLPTPTAMDCHASGGSSPSDVTLTDAIVRTELGARTNPRFGDGSTSADDPPLPLWSPE